MRVEFCPSCGAPLEAAWQEIAVVCRYCGATNVPGAAGAPVPSSIPDDGRPRLHVGGRSYLLEGLLAHGDSCDVFRARWVVRLGELVVIKVLRAHADRDLLQREYEILSGLRGRSADADTLALRLPQPIAFGPLRGPRGETSVAVYEWRSGFFLTLADVLGEFPSGLDGRTLVWVLKRTLELLGWVHRQGIAHGAVLPAHLLVHPRDHGAVLVGWGVAGEMGQRIVAVSRAWTAHYPDWLLHGRTHSTTADVAMAARSVLYAGGATGDGAGALAGDLGRLVLEAAAGRRADAWALLAEVDAAAQREYGPPAYHPLPMPGWAIPER